MSLVKKKIYNEIENSIIWFIIDELILKPIHLHIYLNQFPIYGALITFTKLHPHIMFLLTIIGILI